MPRLYRYTEHEVSKIAKAGRRSTIIAASFQNPPRHFCFGPKVGHTPHKYPAALPALYISSSLQVSGQLVYLPAVPSI
jgi:hypothetical protein